MAGFLNARGSSIVTTDVLPGDDGLIPPFEGGQSSESSTIWEMGMDPLVPISWLKPLQKF